MLQRCAAREVNGGGANVRMASGRNEVETSVDAIVDNLLAVHAVLLLEIGIVARLDVLDDGIPAASHVTNEPRTERESGWSKPVFIVDKVAKSRCIHHVQAQAHTILLDV